MKPDTLQIVAALLFAVAIGHTFASGWILRLAHHSTRHGAALHLLGEVECVFGLWALVLMVVMAALQGSASAVDYLEQRSYVEPLFVFAVMVVAATRPVLALSRKVVDAAAQVLPGNSAVTGYFATLCLLPLLGSFITEAAAMTVAALVLRDRLYAAGPSTRLQYATLGVLLVNVSIGGTLTTFAAPPVLMVAGTWGWDNPYMLTHFGWRAALAVAVNALLATLLFRRELTQLAAPAEVSHEPPPVWVTLVTLLFLVAVVLFAHHPPVFLGLLLFFIGFATAYSRYQDRLIVREALLVGFFLAGLVVLGGMQQWWLQPMLQQMSAGMVFYGTTVLTAITDNAALTYLASLVEGLDEDFKRAIVAGAVTGGGLTVIANAPNPAAFAMLKHRFAGNTIKPMGLLLAALGPTAVAIAAFRLL
jgi:hypothetical protein